MRWVSSLKTSGLIFLVIFPLTGLTDSTDPHQLPVGLDLPWNQRSRVFYVGAGAITPYIGRLSVSASGGTGLVPVVLPTVSAMIRYALQDSWSAVPSLVLTPLGHDSPEGGEVTILGALGCTFAKTFLSSFDFHLGPGLLMTWIIGSGGTNVQSNGTSKTTFALPSGMTLGWVFYGDVGFGYQLQRFRVDLDSLIADPLSSRRDFELALSVSFAISGR